MKLIAKAEFTLNGDYYAPGDEVNAKDIKEINKLNEKGFIEPLTRKELEDFAKNKDVEKKEIKVKNIDEIKIEPITKEE